MCRVIFPVIAVLAIVAQAYRHHGVVGSGNEWVTMTGLPSAGMSESLPLAVGGKFIKPVYSVDGIESLSPQRALI